MRSGLLTALGLAACAGWAVAASPARADAIDGNWCAPDGRTMTIQGPRIQTPGGHVLNGDYNRHGFAYLVPEGEPGTGGRVIMILVNEETVRVALGEKQEIWHRCEVVS